MKPVLIDTDILSEFLRGNTTVKKNVEKYLQIFDALHISIITYYEIQNGLLYKDAKKQLKRFIEFVKLNKVLQLTISGATEAATIYADLRRQGNPIGHTDCLIAGIALANNLPLVTNNSNHFDRVKKLEIVNWMK